MMGKTVTIVIIVSIAVVAILFLAPIVPISMTYAGGLPHTQPPPQMSCSVPTNAIDATLVYNGYESITRYFTGVGILVYTVCYMPQ
jgi:hypothetical protein